MRIQKRCLSQNKKVLNEKGRTKKALVLMRWQKCVLLIQGDGLEFMLWSDHERDWSVAGKPRFSRLVTHK